MVSLRILIPTICTKGQMAIIKFRVLYNVREAFFNNFTEKLPKPVSSNQQNRTRDIVISFPWNCVRNSRTVSNWVVTVVMPVPMIDQMINLLTITGQTSPQWPLILQRPELDR
jgi:hypothetical protein